MSPQSTPERRARWKNDANAIRFLESMGYRLTEGFEWILPSRHHVVRDDEADAIQYLMEEYDFGTFAPGQE